MQSALLPYTVSVVPWDTSTTELAGKNPGAYARSLAELLADSQAFRASRLEAGPRPNTDLVASSTGVYCNTAIVPLLSILSLGLVPTVFDDETCEGMVLRSAKAPATGSIEISVRYKGRVVMGWAAVPLGAVPGWSHGSVGKDPRYVERFRLAIIRRRAEIEQLVGR